MQRHAPKEHESEDGKAWGGKREDKDSSDQDRNSEMDDDATGWENVSSDHEEAPVVAVTVASAEAAKSAPAASTSMSGKKK